MAFPWMQAAMLAMSLMNKRSANDEIPGQAEAIAQALANRRDASTYLNAATNPDSPWFKGLANMFREREQDTAVRGIRYDETRRNRMRARGLPWAMAGNPERRDERVSNTTIDAIRKAYINSRRGAQTSLLAAGGALKEGVPNIPFALQGR